MGSSGTGKFPDYPPSREKKGDGPGQPGGGPEEDKCRRDLSNVNLDEVGGSAYSNAHNNVPNVGTAIVLRTTLLGPRLSIDTSDGQSVGLLPTEYNYLTVCMKRGLTYLGEVTSSSLKPLATVRINLRVTGK
jgi:hypothetical protein